MFRFGWFFVPVLTLLWLNAPGSVSAQEITMCEDFAYQEDAQAAWDRGEGRPQDWYGGWDQDDDGIACESLPAKPFHKQSWFWPGVGVVGLGIVGGGVAFSRRSGRNRIGNNPPAVQQLSAAPVAATVTEAKPAAPAAPAAPTVVNNFYTSADSTSTSGSTSTNQNRNQSRVTGSESDDWRLTPEKAMSMPYEKYLRTSYWQAVRRNNIARAGGRCRDCGRGDQVLQVHHLSYDYLGREDDRFLVVLCAGCHEKRHDIPSPPETQMNA